MRTLKASLTATVIGTGAWLLGITSSLWPRHPQLAALAITLAATAVLMYVWPETKQ